MTPTPDRTETPPAAPLTAEKIAAIWLAIPGMSQDEAKRTCIGLIGKIDAQSDENAALRDRLAQREAQITRLKRAVKEAVQYTHSVPMRAYEEWQDAIAAAPTDGAAQKEGTP